MSEETTTTTLPNDQTIPYATPLRSSFTGRNAFGVVVRTGGLAATFWGIYTVFYVVGAFAFRLSMGGNGAGSMMLYAAFLLATGIALLKGEWLVEFAYGEAPR